MVNDESPTFGVLLSRYRAALGMTQEELAERAGLSARAIGDLERAVKTRPRVYTVRRLAEALRLSPDDLTLFERAARATIATSPVEKRLSEGDFLGAVPTRKLVGREEDCERIASVLETVKESCGSALLLGGEVGAGKTRLLQEIAVEAGRRDFLVLAGHCSRATQDHPYYPFLEELGALVAHVPAGARAECERVWKRIQRTILGRTLEGQSIESAALGEQQFLGAIVELILVAARSTPLALLVDDLHWADDGSLNCLLQLARGTRSAPVLLAGSFCDVHVVEQHPRLAHALADLGRERLAERVTVRRLSLEETGQMVASKMGGEEASEEFVSYAYRRTKGNPRLIDQMVRSLGGRLELRGEIGAGSMGRVFRALDRKTGSDVAAKLVLARSAVELDALLRWQQEGAVLTRLRHPHIVAVRDTFAEEHATCIIMELIEGQSLGQILQDGPLPLERARTLALQVAEGLSYAHGQEIVHRDIKPDNVMVLEGDQVKVTDFGIARILQPETSLQTIATTGMRMGTPLYMAPEQIEGKKIDGRTDIYALGAMLYHMVTGKPPFEGSDALTIAVKHLQEEPAPPSQLDPALPADWDAVILKAMVKDPAQRFQRAAEMREAVAVLPTDQAREPSPQPVKVREIAIGTLSPARDAPTGMRKRTPSAVRVGGVSGAALVAIAVGLWLLLAQPWLSSRAHASTGNPIAVWGVKIPRSFRLDEPANLSAPVSSDLYVADPLHMGIARLSTKTGKLLAAWGSEGTAPGQFRDINDLAVDRHGNVYVIDDTNDRISEFTAAGTLVRTIGHKGFNPGELYGPTALTIDSQGNFLVTDGFNDRIQKLSPTGKPLAVWGSRGHAAGQVYGPNAIRLDSHGNAWVSEHVNLRVQEFSPAGKSLAILGKPGKRPGEFFDPQAVAFDGAGILYVLEIRLDRIQKFSPAGKLLAVWDSKNHPEFKSIQAISIDNRNRLYIVDAGNLSLDSKLNYHTRGQSSPRIHVLTTGGEFLADWSLATVLHQPFRQPEYVALDAKGNAYVSDPGNNTIEKVSAAGDTLLHWGRTGSRPGQFRHPSGIALDASGRVYVADTLNGRIQEFTPNGGFVSAWSTPTGATWREARPTGLAIDNRGNIYVTDPASNLVQEFSASHKLLLQWGRTDSAHSLYWLTSPTGIAADSHGNVYVVDTGHYRVVEYAPSAPYFGTGRPLRSWGGTRGEGPGQFVSPSSVAVDARGNVYVTDVAAARVEVFAPGGGLIGMWGKGGSRPGQFQDPNGIALDPTGNIYVADSGNARIQKFPPAR